MSSDARWVWSRAAKDAGSWREGTVALERREGTVAPKSLRPGAGVHRIWGDAPPPRLLGESKLAGMGGDHLVWALASPAAPLHSASTWAASCRRMLRTREALDAQRRRSLVDMCVRRLAWAVFGRLAAALLVWRMNIDARKRRLAMSTIHRLMSHNHKAIAVQRWRAYVDAGHRLTLRVERERGETLARERLRAAVHSLTGAGGPAPCIHRRPPAPSPSAARALCLQGSGRASNFGRRCGSGSSRSGRTRTSSGWR